MTRKEQSRQTVGRVGNAPARADSLLSAALAALEKRKVLDPCLFGHARKLADYLPSHYLPDVYLVQTIMGEGRPYAALVLDSAERNYLNHLSNGTYLQAVGIPQALEPEHFDRICGLVASQDGISPFELCGSSFDVRNLQKPSFLDTLCARHAMDPRRDKGTGHCHGYR